jgi:hypothetical protein
MIRQFTKYGYSYVHQETLGTGYNSAGFEITKDTSNSPSSSDFPDHCYIDSIELEASGVASTENVQIFLARDSAGAVPVTTAMLSGSTQAPTIRTGSVGGYSYSINKDYHFDSSVANTTSGKIYLFARTTTGAVVINARVNWRS